MKLKPWAKMPSPWIKAGKLNDFSWSSDGSVGTSALMIYYTMCQFASERPLRPSELPEPSPARMPISLSNVTPPPALPVPSIAPGQSLPPWLASYAGASATSQVAQTVAQSYVQVVQSLPSALLTDADDGISKEDAEELSVPDSLIARLTYTDLNALIGISRSKISAGLQKLLATGLIWRVDQSSSYGLAGFGKGQRWAKLPGKALLSAGGTYFTPFKHFNLRSKHELNAMKLHLYYASVRSNENPFCEVAYATIHERTGVSERDIPKANSLLISCGILQRTRGLPEYDVKQHESNKYFLAGYESFFITKAVPKV